MLRLLLIFAASLLALSAARCFAAGYTFTGLNYPGTKQTVINGIVDEDVYGAGVNYLDNGRLQVHCFIYDLKTRQFLNIGKIFFNEITGRAGDTFVGYFYTGSNTTSSFIYDMKTQKQTSVDDLLAKSIADQTSQTPGAFVLGRPQSTQIGGISNKTIFGTYSYDDGENHGFVYDLVHHSVLLIDAPLAGNAEKFYNGTNLVAISGNLIVGWYSDAGDVKHGFIYDLTTRRLTILDAPKASVNKYGGTMVFGISGSNICGSYYNNHLMALPSGGPVMATHGFIYNLQNRQFTTVDGPWPVDETYFTAISGNTAIGAYEDNNSVRHGFLYDLTNGDITPIVDPAAEYLDLQGGTEPEGIFDNIVVGNYTDSQRIHRGFIATPN